MSHYSTRQFNYDKESNEFSTEISNFGPGGLRTRRVFPDACDEGFTLVSEKTGAEVDVFLDETGWNGNEHEKEIVEWIYRPVNKKHTFIVRIWND